MAKVDISHVYKSYGTTEVLQDINLSIGENELIVMVGPSGCGKSTLLRMVAGLEQITKGTISIDDEVVNDRPPAARGIAMVFQNYALYPHMTVRRNMAFSLQLAGLSKQEIESRVNDAAEYLQITPYLDRVPRDLSGGQRQRVAIGRAVVRKPKVFLFDEPLSNLDAALRVATRIQIVNLNERMPETSMIYVTHDQVEAMTLADRIVILSRHGTVEQVGSPIDVYMNPANLFVAQFIGSPAMNILPAELTESADGGLVVHTGSNRGIPAPGFAEPPASFTDISLGVRSEDLRMSEDENYLLQGEVVFIEILGDATQLHVRSEHLDEPIIVKINGIATADRGDTVRLTCDADRMHFFNAKGNALAKKKSSGVTVPELAVVSHSHRK